MTLIPDVLPTLWTLKDVVQSISKKSRFRRPLHSQHGKRAETLFQSQGQHF